MRRKFAFLIIMLFSWLTSKGQVTLWVGESYSWDISSSIMGSPTDMSWSVNGGYISLTGTGFYRNIQVTQYFSGTATVEVSWRYTLYYGDTQKSARRTLQITCNDNPVSIYPTTLRMAPGDVEYLTYDLKFDNSYSYAAQPYFSCGSSIVSVSRDGRVIAKSPGTAYVNVYSKSSSNSPYCTIIVEEVSPTGVSLPSNITLIEGETYQLKATPTPSNATTSFNWEVEDSSIASVSSSGLVTAIKKGETRVKVTTTKGSYSAFCKVKVKTPPPPPSGVSLKSEINIYKGFSTQLVPILEPADAATTYKWRSGNASIVSVSSSGKITANEIGQAEIFVTTANGLEASCVVNVENAPEYIDNNRLKECVSILESLAATSLKSIK